MAKRSSANERKGQVAATAELATAEPRLRKLAEPSALLGDPCGPQSDPADDTCAHPHFVCCFGPPDSPIQRPTMKFPAGTLEKSMALQRILPRCRDCGVPRE